MPILRYFNNSDYKITFDPAYYNDFVSDAYRECRMHDVDINALTQKLSPEPLHGGINMCGMIEGKDIDPEYTMFFVPYKANRNRYRPSDLIGRWILLYCPSGDTNSDGSAKIFETTEAFIQDLFSGLSPTEAFIGLNSAELQNARLSIEAKFQAIPGFEDKDSYSSSFRQFIGQNRNLGSNERGYLTIDERQPSKSTFWKYLEELGLRDLTFDEVNLVYDDFLRN